MNIGRVDVLPLSNSINIKNIAVRVQDQDSKSYKEAKIDRVFLDVASLWDFFSGGTLIIEKFECEGGHLVLFNRMKTDSASGAFSIQSVLQRVKKDAIRFKIQDIIFRDFHLMIDTDSAHNPVVVKQLYARAQNLYLSADSIMKVKPKVEISLPQQSIILPSNLNVAFDSLSFTTFDNSLQFLNLRIQSPRQSSGNYYEVLTDKVRLSHFNFATLYSNGAIEVDSIFLGNSQISVDWLLQPSREKSKNAEVTKLNLPNLDIRNVMLKSIQSAITIRSDSMKNQFSIERASLSIDEFKYRPDSSVIIYSPQYNLLISKYTTFLEESNTSLAFDTIQIQKHSLSLLNFKYAIPSQVKPLIETPRFELKDVDWYEFLVNRKLVANEIRVFDPTITTMLQPSKDKEAKAIDKFELLSSINEFFKVNTFSLHNATAFVTLVGQQTKFELRGFDTKVKIESFINSPDVNQGLSAIDQISFQTLKLANPHWDILVNSFEFSNRSMLIAQAYYRTPHGNLADVSDLKLGNIRWDQSDSTLAIDGIDWNGLNIQMVQLEKSDTLARTENKLPRLDLSRIHGRQSVINFNNSRVHLQSALNLIHVERIITSNQIMFTGLQLEGDAISMNMNAGMFKTGTYSISDKKGIINGLMFNRSIDSLDVKVGAISFQANLPDFLQQRYVIDNLAMQNIQFHYFRKDSAKFFNLDLSGMLVASKIGLDHKRVTAESLNISAGPFDLYHEQWVPSLKSEVNNEDKAVAGRFRSALDTLRLSRYSVKNSDQIARPEKVKQDEADTAQWQRKMISAQGKQGGLQLLLTDIQASFKDSLTHARVTVEATFDQVNLVTEKLRADLQSGKVLGLTIKPEQLKNPMGLITSNRNTLSVQNLSANLVLNESNIGFKNFRYNPLKASGEVHDVEVRPIKSKQQVLDESYYQTNYMHTKLASVSFNNLDVEQLISDSMIHLSSIHVKSPSLQIARDKTKPFFATAIKPLPTNAFKNIQAKFKIDSLNVSDGRINYTEKSRITGQEGTITFTDLHAKVRNVKNMDLHEDDSLHIYATTRFLDSANVTLRVRESYRDTLGGFIMSTQVSPFHTSILNSALVPMVSVDFKSGFVDTLFMRAIGREYISLGSMKFLYHDLKVEFLDKNDTSHHSLKNQLLKFAANTFVIKTNNKDRTGKIFYERDRNRAVFQYWVKMILSGVTTSVGAKSNKKQLKKYLKDLNQKKLPPIEEDFNF